MSIRTRTAITGASLLLLLAGCAVPPPPLADPTPTTPPTASAQPTPIAGVSKVLVFVLENHSLDQSTQYMPYTMALLADHSYATHFTAIRHPSLPNYLAIAGGSTFGVTDDKPPAKHQITGQSVFGSAIAAGRTAGIYAEGMRENCQTTSEGLYGVRHNPWPYFVDERDLCRQFDVPLEQLPAAIDAGTLPNVGMVIPDVCNDAHDCPLFTTDEWYRQWLPRVMAGPDYTSGRLAIVLTADEDNRSQDNTILTGVIHQGSPAGVVTEPLTLYSLTRLLHDVSGTEYLRKAAEAASMSDAFHLTIAGP